MTNKTGRRVHTFKVSSMFHHPQSIKIDGKISMPKTTSRISNASMTSPQPKFHPLLFLLRSQNKGPTESSHTLFNGYFEVLRITIKCGSSACHPINCTFQSNGQTCFLSLFTLSASCQEDYPSSRRSPRKPCEPTFAPAFQDSVKSCQWSFQPQRVYPPIKNAGRDSLLQGYRGE